MIDPSQLLALEAAIKGLSKEEVTQLFNLIKKVAELETDQPIKGREARARAYLRLLEALRRP